MLYNCNLSYYNCYVLIIKILFLEMRATKPETSKPEADVGTKQNANSPSAECSSKEE